MSQRALLAGIVLCASGCDWVDPGRLYFGARGEVAHLGPCEGPWEAACAAVARSIPAPATARFEEPTRDWWAPRRDHCEHVSDVMPDGARIVTGRVRHRVDGVELRHDFAAVTRRRDTGRWSVSRLVWTR